jgi:hypothetical protein
MVAADVAHSVVWGNGRRIAVVVASVDVDAVPQPAELEYDPWLVDQGLEQLIGNLALSLRRLVDAAGGRAREERQRQLVRSAARGP